MQSFQQQSLLDNRHNTWLQKSAIQLQRAGITAIYVYYEDGRTSIFTNSKSN